MSSYLNETGLAYLWLKIKATFIKKSDITPATSIGIDSTPTANSSNLITSGGVYTALLGKEDRSVIIVPESGTIAIHGILGSYYRFDEAVNTLTITLPTVSDTTKIQGIIFFFTTGSTPAVTITTANSAAISYFESYVINPGVTYELNAIFNGLKWVISYARII